MQSAAKAAVVDLADHAHHSVTIEGGLVTHLSLSANQEEVVVGTSVGVIHVYDIIDVARVSLFFPSFLFRNKLVVLLLLSFAFLLSYYYCFVYIG